MGTRGAYGFIIDGTTKVSYNHSDSYPEWLGQRVLEALSGHTLEGLKARARAIRLVPDTEKNYWRLRDFQGDMAALLDGRCQEMIDNSEFLADSLFCEWAYLVNLDTEELEVYRGFNENPNAPGRYAALRVPDSRFYGVALVQTFPLDELPENYKALFPAEEKT